MNYLRRNMNKKIEEIIEDKHNPDRIFPILNKFDRCWSADKDKTFCELYKAITQNKELTDLEFTKALDAYIDNYGIK